MNGRIAFIAALPRELEPLVTHKTAKRWHKTVSDGPLHVWEYAHDKGCWVAACAGMGQAAACRAFAAAEAGGTLDCVVTVGIAGAIDKRACAGYVYSASLVIDTNTGERYKPAHWLKHWLVLVSTPHVADALEKRRLHEAYGAGLADMEGATVARLAESRKIPFYCFKAISDDADAKLPNLNLFIGINGQLQTRKFIFYAMLRPWLWPSLFALGKNSKRGAVNLAEAICDWIDERAYIRKQELRQR